MMSYKVYVDANVNSRQRNAPKVFVEAHTKSGAKLKAWQDFFEGEGSKYESFNWKGKEDFMTNAIVTEL